MKRNSNDIFKPQKTKKKRNPKFKYFAFAFSLFIIILSVFSAFLFMRSIDFDFDNLVDRVSTEVPSTSAENTEPAYSVSQLSGKRSYLFVLTDEASKPDFSFTVYADFDAKQMTVSPYDCTDVNIESVADKYIICTPTQFKNILESFGGVTVNVPNDVNYKSQDFNVVLDKGTQKLSEEYAYKYLAVSEKNEQARIFCDIINSALTPENSENGDELFKTFVNNCKTNISVIDYSNAAEKIKIYSYASDKFYPSVAEQ